MKKIIFLLLTTWSVTYIYAQKIHGVVTYESKTSIDNLISKEYMENTPGMTPEMMLMMREMMKQITEKTFTLVFEKDTSVYQEEINLEAGKNTFAEEYARAIAEVVYEGAYYKNTKEEYFMQEREFLGKEFILKDSLNVFDWQLGTETKQIGNYTCLKAIAKVVNDLSGFEKLKEEENYTNYLDMINIPKEMTITAWYTPEIPVSHGPFNYWGLPGLIMEVSDGQTTILCSKIVLNPENKKEIKAPKKGQIFTKKEAQKMSEEIAKKESQKMERERPKKIKQTEQTNGW